MRRFIIVLGMLAAAGCASNTPRGGTPQVHDGPRGFEPARVNGEVLGADRVAVQDQNRLNVRLRVAGDPEEEEVDVQLGPGWYLDEQGLHFEPNERISVQGSRILVNGRPTIVATEVTKAGRTFRLPQSEYLPEPTPAPELAPTPAVESEQ